MRTEDFIHNDTENIEIRKYQNNLIIVGTGVIALGVLTAIEGLATTIILRTEIIDEIRHAAGFSLLRDILCSVHSRLFT